MNNSKKIKLAIIIFVLALVILFVPRLTDSVPERGPTAVINNKEIRLEIAKSQEEIKRGLSLKNSLAEDAGMLFIYDSYNIPGYWMKDMQFSIDIIWIKDGLVVGVEKSIPFGGSDPLPVYYPPEAVNMVLEVNAGFVEINNIRSGDTVQLNSLTNKN